MKRTPLRKVSKKQAIRNREWSETKLRRLHYLYDKYGFLICEFCAIAGVYGGNLLHTLDGHHIDGDRSNNSDANCYINHRMCHSLIEDHNLQVAQEDFQGRYITF